MQETLPLGGIEKRRKSPRVRTSSWWATEIKGSWCLPRFSQMIQGRILASSATLSERKDVAVCWPSKVILEWPRIETNNMRVFLGGVGSMETIIQLSATRQAQLKVLIWQGFCLLRDMYRIYCITALVWCNVILERLWIRDDYDMLFFLSFFIMKMFSEIDGEPPTFQLKPRQVTTNVGGRAVFTCRVDGDPTPSVHWMVW